MHAHTPQFVLKLRGLWSNVSSALQMTVLYTVWRFFLSHLYTWCFVLCNQTSADKVLHLFPFNLTLFKITIFIVFFVCRRPLTANHYFKYFVKWRFLCFEQLSYTLDSTLLYSNIILSLLLGFRPKLLDLFSYVCTITYTVMYFSPLEKNYVRHNLLIQ